LSICHQYDEDCAFGNCISLKEVVLYKCKYIGNSVFQDCSSLLSVFIYSKEVCQLFDSEVFARTPIAEGNGKIYVPGYLIDQYKTASGWSEISDYLAEIPIPQLAPITVNTTNQQVIDLHYDGSYLERLEDTYEFQFGSLTRDEIQSIEFKSQLTSLGNRILNDCYSLEYAKFN